MNQATLIKIANEVIKNRMLKQAMNPLLFAKPEAVRTLTNAAKEIAQEPQAAEAVVRRNSGLISALLSLLSRSAGRVGGTAKTVALSPAAQNIGAAAGLFGLGALGGYGARKWLGGSPAAPAVPAAPAAAPAIPAGPVTSAIEEVQPASAAGGDLASYLDLLRANAPIVGAAAGGLGGATIGAVASRKARIRNALIGLATGAALGGGAGYLMNR